MWGRVQAVKMVTRLRFLYTLGMLPLHIPLSSQRLIDSKIKSFIWGSLKAHHYHGGLSLPSIEHYYLALQLSQTIYMLQDNSHTPQWVRVECHLLSPESGLSVLYTTGTSRQDPRNPLLASMRKTWQRAHRLLGSNPRIHIKAPIWNNTAIRVKGKTIFWPQWKQAGISTLDQLLHAGELKPFAQLSAEFDLPSHQIMNYTQLHLCLTKALGTRPWSLQTSPVISYLYTWGTHKGVISGLYKIFTFHLFSQPLSRTLHLKWQTRLSLTYDDEDWLVLLETLTRGVREARHKFCLFKILHDWHWSPSKLHKAGLLPHNNCWRCAVPGCDIIHILCSCPIIKSYWSYTGRVLQHTLPLDLPLTSATILLHDIRALPHLSKSQCRLLYIALTRAKICILRQWKSPTPPSPESWLLAMVQTASHERVIYNLNDQTQLFNQIWAPFLQLDAPSVIDNSDYPIIDSTAS